MPSSLPPDWDAIDQASLDSFPASDPPARGGAVAAPSASTVALPDVERTSRRRRAVPIALGVLVVGAGIGLLIWRMRARRAPWN